MKLFEIISPKFILHPKLDPNNYKINSRLSDAKNWKAKVYLANSVGQNSTIEKGDFDQVRYILISITDNSIIPVAISDEHRMGDDLVYYFERKIKGFKFNDYKAISCDSGNYIYNKEQISKWVIAIKKWLSYGGKNLVLTGTYDLSKAKVSFEEFAKTNGKCVLSITPGKLAFIGQKLYDAYQILAKSLSVVANKKPEEILPRQYNVIFKNAMNIVDLLDKHIFDGFLVASKPNEFDDLKIKVKQLHEEENIKGLEQLFFGFDSYKNRLHNELRTLEKKPDSYNNLTATFGDIPLAVDMFGQL
jgi:hypothetical protein